MMGIQEAIKKRYAYWKKSVDRCVSELENMSRMGQDVNSLHESRRGVFTSFGSNSLNRQRDFLYLYVNANKRLGMPLDFVGDDLTETIKNSNLACDQFGESTEVSHGVSFFVESGEAKGLRPLTFYRIVDNLVDEKKVLSYIEDLKRCDDRTRGVGGLINYMPLKDRGVSVGMRKRDSRIDSDFVNLLVAAVSGQFLLPKGWVEETARHEIDHANAVLREYGPDVLVGYGVFFSHEDEKRCLNAHFTYDDRNLSKDPLKKARVYLAPKDPSPDDICSAAEIYKRLKKNN